MEWVKTSVRPPVDGIPIIGIDRFHTVHRLIKSGEAYFFNHDDRHMPTYANPLIYPLWWIYEPEFSGEFYE